MKCPSCGADNSDEAPSCGLCQFVFPRQAAPPPAPSAPPDAPERIDSPESLRRALALGKEAIFRQDAEGARRLMFRIFRELDRQSCAVLVKTAGELWLKDAGLPGPEHVGALVALKAAAADVEQGRLAEALGGLQPVLPLVQRGAKDSNLTFMLLVLGLKEASAAQRGGKAVAPAAAAACAGEYRPGEVLAERYVVQGVLGRGGFGVVYKAFDGTKACAVKTFLDQYLTDPETRRQFKSEAQLWIDLGRSPYLVAADFLFEEQGRLFIDMELVAPDPDGVNTLEGHIRRGAYPRAQALRWAIQFCRGMEYAYAKGVRCHRDIKPANIMVASDGTLKVSDFGLALLGKSAGHGAIGTPAFMPPEQWRDASLCDHRSDQYAFGVTLYQLFGEGRLPFTPQARDDRALAELRALHETAVPPPLEDPLFPVIARCLEKTPERRWSGFAELRARLEEALLQATGEVVTPPTPGEATAADWCNRGTSLCSLGRQAEALACFERALALAPESAQVWMDKGVCLMDLGRLDEALACHDRALALRPDYAWAEINKANVLDRLGRHEEALACCDRAIALRPREAPGCFNKGSLLYDLGRFAEAFACHDQAVQNDPRHARAWRGRGHDLRQLGRLREAVESYERGLAIEPTDASAWMALGQAYGMSKRPQEALAAFDRSLALDPGFAGTWSDKGVALEMLGRFEEALACHERALGLDPGLRRAADNRAVILRKLGRA